MIGVSFVTIFGLSPWFLIQELLRPLGLMIRVLFYMLRMTGGGGLDSFRIGAGCQKDQGMIRGLEL